MKNNNGWYTIKCKFCGCIFRYRLTKEKKKTLIAGYSIDLKCPNLKCVVGLVGADTFGLVKEKQ